MGIGRILSIVLATLLLAFVATLAVMPAAAAGIPCDDGDNELTKDELVNAILPYMLDEGDLKLDDVGDAAYIYAYWDGEPKTIVDQGWNPPKSVTMYRPIERIVAPWISHLEILRVLKIERDKIVGVSAFALLGYLGRKDQTAYFPEIQDKPGVDYNDAEGILNLHPDCALLLYEGRWSKPVVGESCEAAGITVLRINGYGAAVAADVEKLGYVFDREEEAVEFIDWRENIFNTIKEGIENIPEEDKPKVYYEKSKYNTAASRCTHIPETGGKNIFNVAWHTDVNSEVVIKQDPDIIVISRPIGAYDEDDTTEFEELRDELMSRTELHNVTAVKTGKVYVISNFLESWMMCGCRGFMQDAYQAKWFNPTYFDELNPKAIHQEYLTRFQGVDIDLDEKGVFVYHPKEHPDGN